MTGEQLLWLNISDKLIINWLTIKLRSGLGTTYVASRLMTYGLTQLELVISSLLNGVMVKMARPFPAHHKSLLNPCWCKWPYTPMDTFALMGNEKGFKNAMSSKPT